MRHLRKIVWLVIAVAFLASVVIGTGVIFSVKNVNVTLKSYSYSAWDEMTQEGQNSALAEIEEIKNTVLAKYGGKLIPYVNDKELAQSFNGTVYALESCEKVYPCTLNITVKERREEFVISNSTGTFSTFDSFGVPMRRGLSAEEASNNIDGASNVFVYGVTTDEQIASVADVASVFAERFSSLRSVVQKIQLRDDGQNCIFTLHCGISVYIADYSVMAEYKIQAAYSEFLSLTGEEKLHGTVMVTVENYSGEISAHYFDDMKG